MKKILSFSLLVILFWSGFLITVQADTESSKNNNDEIDLAITPNESLYYITNMKPGDWAPKTITVENAGKKDFNYTLTVQNEGAEKLFNELLLEIDGVEGELYRGKLTAFEGIDDRFLASKDKEQLDVTVRFPEHLGNDFQALQSEFSFIFQAEGTGSRQTDEEQVGGIIGSSDNGAKLPSTGTNFFTILLIGGILLAVGTVIGIVHAIRNLRKEKLIR